MLTAAAVVAEQRMAAGAVGPSWSMSAAVALAAVHQSPTLANVFFVRNECVDPESPFETKA
jgi:hypothetical protein